MKAFDQLSEWPAVASAAGVVDRFGNHHRSGGADEVFALASVTKPLTALAVLVAVEEGLIELDQAAGPPRSTVRHLLAHASGLAPDQRRLMTEPGTRRIYSNSGYEVLAELVEAQAQMPFGEYFHEALVVPLGLQNTSLVGSAAHGAFSSVNDLLLVISAVIDATAAVLDSSTVAEMCSPSFEQLPGILPGYGIQDPNLWGLGFEIRGTKSPHWTGSRNSQTTFGHFGRAGTFLWIDPESKLATVVLTDHEFGEWAKGAWPTFSDAVFAELGEPPTPRG